MQDILPLTHGRMEQWREDKLIVNGIQLYVSLHGEPIVDASFGEARPGVEMKTDTILRQHCTAAPLTAFALAPLVAGGHIGLDQPISHFIPAFGMKGKDRVTLRHVLTHTAGLHACDPACLLHSETAILAAVCDGELPVGWVPGAQATYSQFAGWQVLGGVIEKVIGGPLRPHLRESLFLPLGMVDTWVGMTEDDHAALRNRLGVMYFDLGDDSAEGWLGLGPAPMWHDLTREACTLTLPSGAYAPARDLGRFYDALLDRDRLVDVGIMDPGVVDQFVTAQRSGMYDAGLGRICDYGLGFMVNMREHQFGDYCSPRSYGHSGINGSSLAFADEEMQLVVAMLSNDILDWQTCFLRRTAILNSIYEDLGLT